VIKAGLLVGLAQFFTFAFFNYFGLLNILSVNVGIILFANGLLVSAVVMIFLPLFEYLFKVVTNISLLELSDINHPLIKKMIMEAPGTYHHSLIVGNLSEAAAQSIGANAFLARIGSYYHDIGKIEKAGYFSENQNDQRSVHEALSPSMSKMVIMNHVKDGAELAKKYNLKPALIDFITQHHGTSLVYFFYRRALEQDVSSEDIKEEPFRYPGPKPQTKEAAIVLLADSVEAATRSIEDPSPAQVEEVVRKMINNKFIDGQLDECELTLRDLEKISEVFVHILSGIYHSRVEYPEKNENNHKKSTKQNSHKHSPNHQDSQGDSSPQ
jgi:putative nucleotidyltransferase with HDIG domain